MFDDLLRELKRMERERVSVPVATDADGYLDRECPNEECEFQFKVMLADWDEDFERDEMHCPLCGTLAPTNHFWTRQHLEQAKKQAVRHFSGRIGRAMARDARQFNRRQPRGTFITMILEYKGSTQIPALVPIEAAESMQLKIVCDQCHAHFAVVGSAFFCPKCGHSSAVRVFTDALSKIEAKIKHLDRVVEAVATVDKDAAELTRRSLLESGLSDSVVAFQRVMEELYRSHPNATEKVPKNAFQRLDHGSDLWRNAGEPIYADVISEPEMERLRLLFQRRHLLAHREGIVDEQYIERSGDSRYAAGQRIIVRPEQVVELIELVRKLSSAYLPKGDQIR